MTPIYPDDLASSLGIDADDAVRSVLTSNRLGHTERESFAHSPISCYKSRSCACCRRKSSSTRSSPARGWRSLRTGATMPS